MKPKSKVCKIKLEDSIANIDNLKNKSKVINKKFKIKEENLKKLNRTFQNYKKD